MNKLAQKQLDYPTWEDETLEFLLKNVKLVLQQRKDQHCHLSSGLNFS